MGEMVRNHCAERFQALEPREATDSSVSFSLYIDRSSSMRSHCMFQLMSHCLSLCLTHCPSHAEDMQTKVDMPECKADEETYKGKVKERRGRGKGKGKGRKEGSGPLGSGQHTHAHARKAAAAVRVAAV